ncbi:MAG: hypothetical protein JW816_01785 [Candidatus Buchananbacteria bacterium]|nr:hypothetical protein [Candidatus Buchananbacteria bacterium]
MTDNKNNTGQKILDQIKEKNLKPTPRWEFLLKDYLVWGIFVFAIVIGSLATAVIIFVFSRSGWQLSLLDDDTYLTNFLLLMPYFWLLLMIIFVAVAFYNFKHTKTGYRYNAYLVVLTSIVLSLVFGSGIYGLGLGEKFEDIFYQQVPFYRNFVEHRSEMFVRPERGRIAGRVIEITPDYIKVQDFKGNTWQFTTTTDELSIGQRVIIFGQRNDPDDFLPDQIRPWFGPGPEMMPPGRMMPPRF